ncbi:uncharacterized protein LOC125872371 [Solanum stenotomum]|uniref:uncharacterized protein LOC125872371 n=1 Tax=Solanum stenotomum TaxID=172797 RepID=UPI0020D0BB0F|nr:uncharacterized protein LOC125872371 [Solanum stenotomum]
MAAYEALYERRGRSPIAWFEVGEARLVGPDLVHQAMEKVKVIQERLKTAQSQQKSYTDKKSMDNPSLIIPTEAIEIKDRVSYEEIPVQILDCQVRKFRNKEVALVKVHWRN